MSRNSYLDADDREGQDGDEKNVHADRKERDFLF
jgi:hypothetical protein